MKNNHDNAPACDGGCVRGPMKKLILSNCNECPFVGNIETANNKRSDYCYKVHKKLKSSKIPEWCPLEDAGKKDF